MNDNIEYEKFTQEIYNEILKNLYVKNIEVKHNVKLTGKSGQKHQIDVYWEYQYDNTTFKIAIECKNYNHTVSIGKVRDFFGVLYDLEDVKGIMVTKKGYQEGAKKFGEHYGIDLMELREPEEGEAIVAETTLTIDSSVNATHIPLTTKENKIRNAKDEIITDIQKLEEELPENCEQNKDYVFPFDDAYIKTDCGNIKIKEIKFEYENHTTKAILKNTISKEVQLIGKTYMDYKSQMK